MSDDQSMNPRFMWPATALASIGLVVAGAMAIAGVPTETIVVLATLMTTPVLAAFVAGQLAEVKGTQNQVMQNTNGTNARLIDIIEAQSKLLHSATPGVPNVPPDQPDQQAA